MENLKKCNCKLSRTELHPSHHFDQLKPFALHMYPKFTNNEFVINQTLQDFQVFLSMCFVNNMAE